MLMQPGPKVPKWLAITLWLSQGPISNAKDLVNFTRSLTSNEYPRHTSMFDVVLDSFLR